MTDPGERSDPKTDWAERRTDWAEDRTALANERTFAAWVRTALTSAALGLGFNALVRSFEPTWLAKAGATLFLVIAIAILFVTARNARGVEKRLETHGVEALDARPMRLIAAALSFACFAVIVIIWLIDASAVPPNPS